MIIDCHGHFTTVPASFRNWRAKQIEYANDPTNAPTRATAHVSDDEIRAGVGDGRLKLQQEFPMPTGRQSLKETRAAFIRGLMPI